MSRPQNCNADRLFRKFWLQDGGFAGFFWHLEGTHPTCPQGSPPSPPRAPTPAVSRLTAAPSGQRRNPRARKEAETKPAPERRRGGGEQGGEQLVNLAGMGAGRRMTDTGWGWGDAGEEKEEKGRCGSGCALLRRAKEQEGRQWGWGWGCPHSLSLSSVCQLLPSSSMSCAGLPSGFRLSLLLSPS